MRTIKYTTQFKRDLKREKAGRSRQYGEKHRAERFDMAARTNRTEKLDLRLTAQAKRALQSAAKATHKTLGDFVLESALARADSVLAERQIFRLDAQKWAAFLSALDAPPKPRPRLAKLLSESGSGD
jgi:uncharacterized protein (DUF1778 family)